MSLAISLKINDGVVLAADSAATVLGQVAQSGQVPNLELVVLNTYNNANKIFNLRKGLPIGLITWGAGSIGTDSISTLAKDLRRRLSGDDEKHKDWELDEKTFTIKGVVERVCEFMYAERYLTAFKDWPQKPGIGFIVAGYSASAAMADEYLVDISNGRCSTPVLVRQTEETGITWGGVGEVLSRLCLGFASGLPQVLQQILKDLNIPAAAVPNVIAAVQASLPMQLVVPAMPLQDAIDLAEFLVDTTIQWVRFSPGAPTVAGPIEIAAISKHEGFRWIRRKYYFEKNLNPEETWKRKAQA